MMAQDIRTRLILDNSQFQRGMEQSQRQTRGFGQSMMGLVRTVKIATAAVAALAAGITAMARRTADSAAQIRDLSRSIGVGARAIQQFRFAAQQNSVDIASADRALEQFTRRIGEAARGTGEARSALAEMGISLRDNNGRLRDSQDILRDVADAFQRTNDATRNADRANRLFGRSGIELISVLRGGSESLQQFADQTDRLGALSDAEVQTLGKLSDSYTTLRVGIRGVVNQFVLGLVPALESTNEELIDLIENNQEAARALGERLGKAVEDLTKAMQAFLNVGRSLLEFLQTDLGKILAQIPLALVSFTIAIRTLAAAFNIFTKTIRILLQVLVVLTGTIGRLGGPLALVATSLFLARNRMIDLGDTSATVGEILRALGSRLMDLVRDARRWVLGFRDIFTQFLEAAQETFGIALGLVQGFVNFSISAFLFLPRVAKLAFDQLRRVITGEGEATLSEYQDMIQELFETDFIGDAADSVRGFLQRIVQDYRRTQGALGNEGPLRIEIPDGVAEEMPEMLTGWRLALSEFFEGFREGFQEFQNSLQTNTQLGAAVFKRFTDGMTDALTRFFTTGKLSFRNFLADIAAMIIRSNVQQALAAVLGSFSFFGGGTSGAAMSAFGQGIHNLLASPFGKALGGMIPAGKVGLVGERGPEFIRGPAQITPIRQGDMAPQTTQVTYNIEAVDAASFRDLVAQDPEFLFGVTQRGARGFAS